MKNLLIATFLICFCNTSYSQGWSLVWEDDFSGTTLDQTKWTHDLGTGSQYGLWGWGNGELQFYQAGNAEVSNGTLKIIAKEEPGGIVDSWGNTMYYSSSKIKTENKFFEESLFNIKIQKTSDSDYIKSYYIDYLIII